MCVNAFSQGALPCDASCSIFPDSKKQHIYKAFEAILGEGAALDRCVDASNNINDKVYKVSTKVGQNFALRLASRTSYAKKRTISRSTLGADLRVAPTVHWADDTQGIIITDWVQGTVLHRLNPPQILKIAQHLQKVHKSPMDRFSELYTIGMRARQRLKDIVKIWPSLAESLGPYREKLAEIESALGPTHDVRIIHGDLNQGNILEAPDGHIFLIDWGDSVAADIYDDLAGLAHYFHLSSRDMYSLLKLYLGRVPTKKEWAKLYLKRLETVLHHGLWAYLQIHRFRDKNHPPQPIQVGEEPEVLFNALRESGCMTLPNEGVARRIAAMALKEFQVQAKNEVCRRHVMVLQASYR